MTTKISVITPTADQPMGIELLEKYMARQTVQPDEWIVSDDGISHARLTMGQKHIARPRTHDKGQSLAQNIIKGLEVVTGNIVLIMEHDDYYAPNHIEVCVNALEKAEAAGSKTQRYYNVEHRCWLVMANVGSSLCNTAFHAKHIPMMHTAARVAFSSNLYSLDRIFWDSMTPRYKVNLHDINTVVGIKGLPGRVGLGLGHRPDKTRPWKYDKDLSKLREWIGDDADNYLIEATDD